MATIAVVGLGLLGLLLLTLAADQLVLGAGRLATMLRIAPVAVGVVVIGLGTSAPEFLVSGVASAHGNSGIAIGNLVGSNIINLTLVLGASAMVAPVAVRSSVPAREAPAAIAATVVFGGLALLGLTLAAGILLALLGAAAIALLIHLARTQPDTPMSDEVAQFLEPPPPHRWPLESLRTLLGLAGTLGGAQLLVANATVLAQRWGVSDAVIGFTLVALGTSLPELVTAIQAQRRGESDLLVGNLLGSNLFNSLIGGGIVGLLSASTRSHVTYPAIAAMIGVSLLAWLLLFRGYRITRIEGGILIAAYLGTLPLLG